MELKIVSKEIIKPSSPTPPELRNLPLCLFDQHAPNVYIQLIYFYDNNNNVTSSGRGRRQLLKDSLSKALTFYYPFAGRLGGGGNSIECNDTGVAFSEARLLQCRRPMMEFMNDDINLQEIMLKLLTCREEEEDIKPNPLLSVQLLEFECGEEVMFVFLSHKVADLATLCNFMNDWASIARNSGDRVMPMVSPQFNAAGFFPPELDVGGDPSGGEKEGKDDHEEVCTKRFVFEGSKIAALKAMVSKKVENPTRVQILTAFIYKALLSAKKSVSTSGDLPSSSLLQLINLRTRVEPSLPTTIAGNIISFFIASSTTSEQSREEMELWNFVDDVKRNFEGFCKNFPRDYKAKEWGSLHKLYTKESMERWRNPGDDHILVTCTSWCKFPLYDADFGWGKPIWITMPAFPIKNMIILMDSKDGEGVEAMVSLEKEEMVAFQQNEELLSFCKLS